MEFDYDFFVIGAGSGGVRASRIAAQLGKKVAIAESRYLGGTCVNVGCVPKKLFVYGSHFHEEFLASEAFGWDVGQATLNWDKLRDNKTKEIERLNGIYENLLINAGVTLYNGHAKLMDSNTISIDGETVTAKKILIATGGWPFVPDFPGREHVITSNETFYLAKLPKSIVIVGGGYIAVEFAGIFNGLGVETHLVYRGSLILRGFDQDIREHALQEIEKKGVQVYLDTNIKKVVSKNDEQYDVHLNKGETLKVEKVMYATGRRPMTDGLGLENTTIELNDKGQIKVDRNFQTNEPSIYALGDVKGGIELTPVAIAEAMALVHSLFDKPRSVDYSVIPTAVFSQPPIGTVGLTEQEARAFYPEIEIYQTDFRHLKNTLSNSQERVFMKLIVDKATDKVVGCHMVGPDAGEIIQGFAVAMKAGATKADFDNTIGIHPTAAEEFVTLRQVTRN
ncbi:glutathione-disulfide reductase [Aurantivibrio infirmus]